MKIEGLFRLRDHLSLTIVQAMRIKRRGDLPALWNELRRKYQYEEASVTAIGAPGVPGPPPQEPQGAVGGGEYNVPWERCPEPNDDSLDYIASYKKPEGKTHNAYWLRSEENGLCLYVFEGEERTQFFCKKHPRDTSVHVTRLNNRMVKSTYARMPAKGDRPERVWTEIERCRPIAEVLPTPMSDKDVNGYDMIVVFLARAIAGPEPPRPMGMAVPPDSNLPTSSRTAQTTSMSDSTMKRKTCLGRPSSKKTTDVGLG